MNLFPSFSSSSPSFSSSSSSPQSSSFQQQQYQQQYTVSSSLPSSSSSSLLEEQNPRQYSILYVVQRCWHSGPKQYKPVDFLRLFRTQREAEEVAYHSAKAWAVTHNNNNHHNNNTTNNDVKTLLLPSYPKHNPQGSSYGFISYGALFWVRATRATITTVGQYHNKAICQSEMYAIITDGVIGGTGNFNSRRGTEIWNNRVFGGDASSRLVALEALRHYHHQQQQHYPTMTNPTTTNNNNNNNNIYVSTLPIGSSCPSEYSSGMFLRDWPDPILQQQHPERRNGMVDDDNDHLIVVPGGGDYYQNKREAGLMMMTMTTMTNSGCGGTDDDAGRWVHIRGTGSDDNISHHSSCSSDFDNTNLPMYNQYNHPISTNNNKNNNNNHTFVDLDDYDEGMVVDCPFEMPIAKRRRFGDTSSSDNMGIGLDFTTGGGATTAAATVSTSSSSSLSLSVSSSSGGSGIVVDNVPMMM